MICFAAQRLALLALGRSVDSAWEQKKPEARKMLENAAVPSVQCITPALGQCQGYPGALADALLAAIFARNSLKSPHLTHLNSICDGKS